jgi:hypothetical protein
MLDGWKVRLYEAISPLSMYLETCFTFIVMVGL